MDIEEDDSKERTKVKNQRRNYTMSEKQLVIKNYEKSGNLRETARKFDISPGTLAGWIKNKDLFQLNKFKQTDLRFKGGGRKSDSEEYDEVILNFIKEEGANDIAITSSEVIFKAIEVIPDFKNKTYDSLHHWFKRFRERYKFALRKVQ